jgi:beta-N-acetylhexosaminidase
MTFRDLAAIVAAWLLSLGTWSCASSSTAPVPAPVPAGDPTPVVASPDPAETVGEAGPPTLLEPDAASRRWVDSVLSTLDTRGRAAQLVVPWMSGRFVPVGGDEWDTLRRWVEDAGVGGIITSIGPPVALADKLNRLQRAADIPLLVATDMEHGPGQRLRGGTLMPWGVDLGGGTSFPPAMALGAAGDPSLARSMGRITGLEGRAVGIHLDFAPVVDVNNNPDNPIINTRSYGEDPARVAEFGAAHVRGLHEGGMLSTAKHFPGHGDVADDTHLVPLILRIDAARADSVELVPFRAAIGAGADAVMTAHIAFPALAGDSTLPATLSPRMLDSLLVGELGFKGLVVTDALNMGAIVARFGAGDAAVRALEAGADLLLQPADPFVVIDAVTAAVEGGRITEARLERSVRKVLEAKARVGLHRRRTVELGRVAEVVGAPAHGDAAAEAAQRSITLVRDRDGRVPLDPDRHRRVLVVAYTDQVSPFAGRALTRTLGREIRTVERVALGPGPVDPAVLDGVARRAEGADFVVLAVNVAAAASKGTVALDPDVAAAFRAMAERRPTALVSFGSPYLLRQLPELGTYLLAWSGSDAAEAAVGRALTGRAGITGRLPITIPALHERGAGLVREAPAPAALDSLDAVVLEAIRRRVTPGAAVAVGTSKGLLRLRGYGTLDYAPPAAAVSDSTVYDLASLTKVVATTSAVMLLVDRGRIELDAPLSRYLPAWPEGGWRDRVTVRRLLEHRAGLPAFVRFWHPSEGALRGVEPVIDAIAALEPSGEPGERYVYSDLGFILLGAMVEAVTGTDLADFTAEDLWNPLGMGRTRFTPPAEWRSAIAPTEVDQVYRHTHVRGEVHDENAHAMGGVAGHAGLFSTARDLSRFATSLLVAARAGADEGERAGAVPPFPVSASTVAAFTTRRPGTERGLGWDVAAGTGIAEAFSAAAFGHTGFTGTSLWIDPERDLYVVLLTNRVNPSREGRGITGLRRAVHGWAVRVVDGR